MSKQISLIVFVSGLLIITYGIGASNSFSSDISQILAGSATERTVALFYGGTIFTALGGYGLARQ